MKKTFVKPQGRYIEKLIIQNEEKWIHVQYFKAGIVRTSYILKNSYKTDLEYLEPFFKDNHVSEEMIEEVVKFLSMKTTDSNTEWQHFILFLLNMLSIHIVLGVTMGITIYTGFKIGDYFDTKWGIYPTFTLLGVFSGLIISGLTGYIMYYKYIKQDKAKQKTTNKDAYGERTRSMFSFTNKGKNEAEKQDWPIIDINIEEVRNAVRNFSENLPKGVYRTILVKDDFSIDFEQLTHILKGIPSKHYYMSKETYDIFEEEDKEIPSVLDTVQKAVDAYVKDNKKYPMLQYDPLRRVNYYELLQEHYLDTLPELELYITDYDGLITHVKPKKKGTV